MPERWMPIPGLRGYEVSDLGRVRTLKKGAPRVITQRVREDGYLAFRSYCAPDRSWHFVHGAVLAAFAGERPDGQVVRHLNGSRTDNRLSNLAYGTPSENLRDQVRHGTHINARKVECRAGHAYDDGNTYLRAGKRNCRACNREAVARYKRSKRVEP